MRYKGGEPPLMIYECISRHRRVIHSMICPGCGLDKKILVPKNEDFFVKMLRKRYFCRSLIRFRTPTEYEINKKVESILVDKLEFTYLNLSLNRPSGQHQYRIIYNHIPRLTDLQRILLFHYPEHIILQIIIFSFSYNYTPSLNSYLSVSLLYHKTVSLSNDASPTAI